jgi:aminopeptidase-like protein
VIAAVDANQCWLNLSPKGEPRLGKRGLYSTVGGSGPGRLHEHSLLWLLNQSDGQHDLIDIAGARACRSATLAAGAQALHSAGLLAPGMSTSPKKET